MSIILRERLYIPAKNANRKLIEKKYQRRIYKEDACIRCDYFKDRYNDLNCGPCPAYKGQIKLWHDKTIDGQEYIAVPSGNKEKIKKRLGITLDKVNDQRTVIPMKNKLKFTGKLYKGGIVDDKIMPNQQKLVDEWLKTCQGVVEAPPRTGKTVIGVNLVCKLGQRTLIVASQELWLRQFARSFRQFTNAKDIKSETGRLPYILVENRDQLENSKKYDIVLLTYQKFISLKQQPDFENYIANNFGFLLCDEVHMGNAFAFSKFLGNINSRYKCGLTATPKRVDGMHFIVDEIIGPVVAKSKTIALLPTIKIWESNVGSGKTWKTWHGMEKFIYNSNERNIQIIRQVFKDLRENSRHSILIPVAQLEHMRQLVDLINRQAKVNCKKRNEDWPENLAQPFWSGMNRKETLSRITNYESRVTVAIARMVQMGLDIPEWSHVYIGIKPTSSHPMFYQLANRCCTPAPWEKSPIVRLMVDPNQMSIGCFRKLMNNEIQPHLEGNHIRYQIEKSDLDKAIQIKHSRSYRFFVDPKKSASVF